jgi:Membrane dipeptidase (Peptidase family M19)
MDAVPDHIEYVADLVGWKHVSLGTDWPNQVPDETQRVVWGRYSGSWGSGMRRDRCHGQSQRL